jgi:hypothetical protein
MKVFVSSLISGFEPYRAAATAAIRSLGHEPITAEAFAAGAAPPRVACLEGVRQSAVVLVIAGAGYGALQEKSGLSATHEEYREAQGRRPVLAFVQSGVEREPAQESFVRELQDWEKGHFRKGFSTPDELRDAVTAALHQWEISTAVAPVDSAELLVRARALLPEDDRRSRRSGGAALHIAVVGGPTQPILRPAEIERAELSSSLLKAALFGEHCVFDRALGSTEALEDGVLVLKQDSHAAVTLDERGDLAVTLPVKSVSEHVSVIIDELVANAFDRGLGYASHVLDQIDGTQRLSRIVIAATLSNASGAWRTRAEHAASPNSVSWGGGFGNEQRHPVHLQPPDRARAALKFERERLVEDLTALLRRQWHT